MINLTNKNKIIKQDRSKTINISRANKNKIKQMGCNKIKQYLITNKQAIWLIKHYKQMIKFKPELN